MTLSVAISSVLDAEANVEALACVDLDTGIVVFASTRDGAWRVALDAAVKAAKDICMAPVDAHGRSRIRETFVVSDSTVHVFSPSKRRRGCVFVAVARGSANLALVLSAVRSLEAAIVDPDAQ